MTAYINKIKSKAGDQQLPVTHERAVRDDNGTTLESKLQNLEGAMDKAYVAQSDNGMGRITLKKNMVGGVNTLTRNMMQATNTIYVIRYDFTLGENITVPANCVLEFDGGSVSGNWAYNNNVKIVSNTSKPIIYDGILYPANQTDILLNREIMVSWFKSTADATNEDSKSVKLAIDTVLQMCHINQYGVTLKFDSAKEYRIDKLGVIDSKINIDLNNSTIDAIGNSEEYFLKILQINSNEYKTKYCAETIIHNGTIKGGNGNYKNFIVIGEDRTTDEEGELITRKYDVTNLVIRDIKFYWIQCAENGFLIKHFYGYGTTIQQCTFEDGRGGAVIASFHDLYYDSNTRLGAFTYELRVQNCSITCVNFDYGILILNGGNVRVQNCIIEAIKGYNYSNGGQPVVYAAGVFLATPDYSIMNKYNLLAYGSNGSSVSMVVSDCYFEDNACDIRVDSYGIIGVPIIERCSTNIALGPFVKIKNYRPICVRNCIIKGNSNGGIEPIEGDTPEYYAIRVEDCFYGNLKNAGLPNYSKGSLMNDAILAKNHNETNSALHIGGSASRYYNMDGDMYIDTEINPGKKTPIWWTGSEWVDATGTPV